MTVLELYRKFIAELKESGKLAEFKEQNEKYFAELKEAGEFNKSNGVTLDEFKKNLPKSDGYYINSLEF
ncbi:MAG: hypothetical protein RLY40_7 [Pseudomonadota bacterium]|jgi:hypothetical protein